MRGGLTDGHSGGDVDDLLWTYRSRNSASTRCGDVVESVLVGEWSGRRISLYHDFESEGFKAKLDESGRKSVEDGACVVA